MLTVLKSEILQSNTELKQELKFIFTRVCLAILRNRTSLTMGRDKVPKKSKAEKKKEKAGSYLHRHLEAAQKHMLKFAQCVGE